MNKQKGFTLIEAAVAIGVVAILSGIIIPLVLKNIRDAQNARAKNDIMVIAGAIASQLKDTGNRPKAPGGPGGATGLGDALWASSGTAPAVEAGGPLVFNGGNTFTNLFTAPNNVTGTTRIEGNNLFGFNNPLPARAEFGYKGPYLGQDMTTKTDPWGNTYLILGYNERGQNNNGAIWVVSAGYTKTIHQNNLTLIGNRYRDQWNYQGLSKSNIAVRVH